MGQAGNGRSRRPKVIAAGAADVPEDLAHDVGTAITNAILGSGLGNPTVLSVRFVPSSRVSLPRLGGYELLANTTIEFGTAPSERRKTVLESIVKISETDGRQSLKEVALPGLP